MSNDIGGFKIQWFTYWLIIWQLLMPVVLEGLATKLRAETLTKLVQSNNMRMIKGLFTKNELIWAYKKDEQALQ